MVRFLRHLDSFGPHLEFRKLLVKNILEAVTLFGHFSKAADHEREVCETDDFKHHREQVLFLSVFLDIPKAYSGDGLKNIVDCNNVNREEVIRVYLVVPIVHPGELFRSWI